MFFRLWVNLNKVNTLKFVNIEMNKLILKSLLCDFQFSKIERIYFYLLFSSYSHNMSISKFRSFCFLSNYPRSVKYFFRLSRYNCKKYASYGLLMGMRKSSF